MIELLLDNYVLRIWVICVIGFIVLLSGEVYLTSTLISQISAAASSAVVIVVIKTSLRSSPRVLLKLFGYTILLKMSYLIASPASNIDASSWPGDQILFFLLLV